MSHRIFDQAKFCDNEHDVCSGEQCYQIGNTDSIAQSKESRLPPFMDNGVRVMNEAKANLIALLQLAYSGEKAAGYAYRGHWQSLTDPSERTRIAKIEQEEWHHRTLLGDMLATLNATPDRTREYRAAIIGRVLGFLCHLTGWLLPMYGAGKLESRNIREYEAAARYARDCGNVQFIECLLEMAEVEWEHEHYFRSQVLRHRLSRYIPLWPQPPQKSNIRESFQNIAGHSPAVY
jgi:rubrerythrin